MFRAFAVSFLLALSAAFPARAARPELFVSTGVSVVGVTAGLQFPLSPIAELHMGGAWLPRAQAFSMGGNVFTDSSWEHRTRLFLAPELLYFQGDGDKGRYQRLYAQLLLGGEHRFCGRIRFALEVGPGVLLRNGFDAQGSALALPFSLMLRSRLLFPVL
jgi:hypothetical protein